MSSTCTPTVRGGRLPPIEGSEYGSAYGASVNNFGSSHGSENSSMVAGEDPFNRLSKAVQVEHHQVDPGLKALF